VAGPSLVRLFAFRAVEHGFDERLRATIIPDLATAEGLTACFSARQGPDDLGPRLVVTTWRDRDAMVRRLGEELGTFHPEALADTADRRVEILPLIVAERFAGAGEPRILRVFRGRVRPGELDEYVSDLRDGAALDAASGDGPTSIHLGQVDDDRFVTVTTWRAWDHVEEATGGDHEHPWSTRQPGRLLGWQVDHYELVTTVSPAVARDAIAAS